MDVVTRILGCLADSVVRMFPRLTLSTRGHNHAHAALSPPNCARVFAPSGIPRPARVFDSANASSSPVLRGSLTPQTPPVLCGSLTPHVLVRRSPNVGEKRDGDLQSVVCDSATDWRQRGTEERAVSDGGRYVSGFRIEESNEKNMNPHRHHFLNTPRAVPDRDPADGEDFSLNDFVQVNKNRSVKQFRQTIKSNSPQAERFAEHQTLKTSNLQLAAKSFSLVRNWSPATTGLLEQKALSIGSRRYAQPRAFPLHPNPPKTRPHSECREVKVFGVICRIVVAMVYQHCTTASGQDRPSTDSWSQ